MEPIDLEKLRAGSVSMGFELSEGQLLRFARFSELLQEWNQRMNLTRIPPEEFVTLHFLDSLLALGAINLPIGARIIDVGTGAGFPGIPLKIARPDLRVTLLDSTRKKLGFVDHVISELGLTECSTVHLRAEEAVRLPEHNRQYDFAFGRAVARLDKLAAWLLPFVKPGGSAVALKSGEAEKEIAEAHSVINHLGGVLEVKPRTIPGTDIARTILVITAGSAPWRSRSKADPSQKHLRMTD